jgi:hypothetical protein
MGNAIEPSAFPTGLYILTPPKPGNFWPIPAISLTYHGGQAAISPVFMSPPLERAPGWLSCV